MSALHRKWRTSAGWLHPRRSSQDWRPLGRRAPLRQAPSSEAADACYTREDCTACAALDKQRGDARDTFRLQGPANIGGSESSTRLLSSAGLGWQWRPDEISLPAPEEVGVWGRVSKPCSENGTDLVRSVRRCAPVEEQAKAEMWNFRLASHVGHEFPPRFSELLGGTATDGDFEEWSAIERAIGLGVLSRYAIWVRDGAKTAALVKARARLPLTPSARSMLWAFSKLTRPARTYGICTGTALSAAPLSTVYHPGGSR
jgi:hypothetical protein